MPSPRRRGMLPRRRRRDDEGEDESSNAGDIDDFSLSEGSAISNVDDDADVEGSEVSAEDEDARVPTTDAKSSGPALNNGKAQVSEMKSDVAAANVPQASPQGVINGLPHAKDIESSVSLQGALNRPSQQSTENAIVTDQETSQPQGPSSERPKKEHLEYVRQRNSNPAFVPNRGGFFLHDDRSASLSSLYGRPFPRGRGRGFNAGYGIGRGFGPPAPGPTDRQWAHDLHDAVNKSMTSPSTNIPAPYHIPTAKPAATAPNRNFSISTVLGNVTIQVFLPGMKEKKTVQNLVKKQHTLLPQHRPPLRRDKPVRISIPDKEPRSIFPSTERSFIFIPRAMRPNQQIYTRGRGRGSFHGSRRPSIMGSAYTPSVAMSRKSSIGAAGSTGLHTPTDGTMPRGPMIANFNRPVVRMPVSAMGMAPPLPIMPLPNVPLVAEQSSMVPTIYQSPTITLPMYQPQPQKAVSVAEIESPAVKGPQQQQEQPFHQQMPQSVGFADNSATQQGQSLSIHAPLSHIPEGAVYAQPFQPYPMYHQNGYYNPAFPAAPLMYHGPADPYAMTMGGPVLPPHFAPGQSFVPGPQASESNMQPTTMMQETNGMVYYYDPNQYATDGSHASQYPMSVGGSMMGVSAPGAYYYPAVPGGIFYPPAQ